MRTSRAVSGLLFLLLSVGACQATPPASPSVPAPTATAAASLPAPTAGATLDTTTLGGRLRAAISIEDILAGLAHLEGIAAANGGNRAAGSPGHDASAAFVADELRAAGYDVKLLEAQVATFRVDAPTVLEILAAGAPVFQETRDVKPMLLSPSGDVTAELFPLGFNTLAVPGDRGGLGCDPADFVGVPAGVVVLVQPGQCRRRDVLVNAQAVGALAVIMAYPDWTENRVLRPTLVEPEGLTAPIVGVTHDAGLALFDAAEAGTKVHLAVSTTVEVEATSNVIAETPGGDAEHVLMLGGHLDSVVDGPGINDNGSGTMTVLEIARELAGLVPDGASWKVRVAFWTAEETGLLGSFDYVGTLSQDELAAIEAYLNFDMLGSANGVRQVYSGASGSRPSADSLIRDLFSRAFDDAGQAWETVEVGGASDHFPFDQLGVPVGGLFSGASEAKTLEQSALFGGTVGQPADNCYHLSCDTAANIDPVLLEEMARAAAWVTGVLAEGEVVIPEG